MKKQLFNLFLQIIPVMIGVYLGFAVTNWGEQRNRAKETKTFVKIIEQELDVNKNKIEQVIDYHRMLRDSARHYLETGKRFKGQPEFFEGIRTQNLLLSAYDTGIQTGILNELELTKIQRLNLTYGSLKSYNQFAQTILSTLINLEFNNSIDSQNKVMQFIALSMTDLVIKEEKILKGYALTKQEVFSSSPN